MLPTRTLKAHLCQFRHTVRSRKLHVQGPQSENHRNGNLLRFSHLQFPEIWDRQHQKCNVSQDIRRRGTVISHVVFVDAMTARYRLVPVVGERDTSKEKQEHVSDEPYDNDNADNNADDPKLSLRKNPTVEEEYG